MSVLETLQKLGFNEKEIKVYVALLKRGKVRPSALAKITKINRATVYNIAKGLLSKGVIAEDLGGNTLFLTPLPLESLSQVIDKPRRELEKKEALVKKAIAGLSLLTANQEYSVPKIRFVEEQNVEDFLYDNTLKWIKELHRTDGEWWSFQDHSLVEHYEKFIEWVGNLKEYKDPKVHSYILTNKAPIEEKIVKKIPRSKREIRFVDGMNFTSSIWISGDYVVMLATRNHPFYIVEIHDAMLAHNLREVFKKLWSLTEKTG